MVNVLEEQPLETDEQPEELAQEEADQQTEEPVIVQVTEPVQETDDVFEEILQEEAQQAQQNLTRSSSRTKC